MSSDPKCMVLSDKRDNIKKLDEICINPTSLRTSESFRTALEDWFRDIWIF
jgi:hypothetical protein